MLFTTRKKKVFKKYVNASTHSKFMKKTMISIWFKKIIKLIWRVFVKYRVDKIVNLRSTFLAHKVIYYFRGFL